MSMEMFLGLGSNMGDRMGYLQLAVEVLQGPRPGPHGLAGLRVGSARWPGTPGQVPELRRPARDRPHRPPAPRGRPWAGRAGGAGPHRCATAPAPLDVDILLFGDLEICEPDLVVPHPRMSERGFVLAPLEDLDAIRVSRPAGAPGSPRLTRRLWTCTWLVGSDDTETRTAPCHRAGTKRAHHDHGSHHRTRACRPVFRRRARSSRRRRPRSSRACRRRLVGRRGCRHPVARSSRSGDRRRRSGGYGPSGPPSWRTARGLSDWRCSRPMSALPPSIRW